ncbi:unnamed protein product [Periconia digitata]|uniref:Cyclochlorotine biosynthesis protein O n=1 Tax=Periconia digitata TaxID=1303443 RepID=A0A9W4UC67_9PLEO|nr:unnamed protein product [Periconia digitata]
MAKGSRPDDEESLSDDQPFLRDKEVVSKQGKRRSFTCCTLYSFLFHSVFSLTYCVLLYILIGPKIEPRATALHPINALNIQHVAWSYDDFEQSPYSGKPRASLEKEWHRLLEGTTIRVSEEELRASNQSSVALPEGGGYMAWLGVYHELHCIKMIRQWIYRDHYHTDLPEKDVPHWSIHADHCLDLLRSAAMCHGDTTLTTFGWAEQTKPMLNTRPIDHECVDWEKLTESVKDRVVDRKEMASLVNPNLV